MLRNTAGQTIAFNAIDPDDGAAVTSGTPAVYYCLDAGTQATGAGACVHEGNGVWSYAPAQAETNAAHVSYTFVLASAINHTINVYPSTFDYTEAAPAIYEEGAIWLDSSAANTLSLIHISEPTRPY